MSDANEKLNPANEIDDAKSEGRDQYYVDIDRMVNEGLGGGTVTMHNGLIDETTTDTMLQHERRDEERP